MKTYIQILLVFFLFISCSKSFEPEVIPNYSLNVSVTPTEGGTVTPFEGSYPNGTAVSLLATPSPEYIFKEWNGGVTGTTNPISVTMSSNKNISVVFEKRKYPLSITIEGEGTVTEELLQSKSNTDYPSGSVVKLTAVPIDGWRFVGWSGDVSSTELSIDLTISKAKSVVANFNNPYIPALINEFYIQNPNEHRIMLQQTFYDGTAIFYYEKNGIEYIIVPGKSTGMAEYLGANDKENVPKSKAFALIKNNNNWSEPIPQNDLSKMWSVRNFDSNDEFFVLADGNEIGDWTQWSGDLVIGKPNGESINWSVVNSIENRAFNHDVSIGDVNGDGIADVLGSMLNFFISNGNTFIHKPSQSYIEYNWNYPLAFCLYDLDSDGIDEIISADYNEEYLTEASNHIIIHKWNSNENKYKEVFSRSSGSLFYNQDLGATSIEAADFNNDGIIDICIAREGGGGRSFEIWKGEGQNKFTPNFSIFFSGTDYVFQEFEIFDANNDGFLDILLRPFTNGGNPTNLFHINGRFEDGIKLNNSIWLNNRDATFSFYSGKDLISLERAFYAIPYKGLDDKLHYFGFWQTEGDYNSNSKTMKVRMFDLMVELD